MNQVKITEPIIEHKGWGCEIIITNNNQYCSKILRYNKGAKSSGHFHHEKHETWYVASGKFTLTTINPYTAERKNTFLFPGTVVDIPQGCFHKLVCAEAGDIYEASTPHKDEDSYRIEAGDSQTALS